MWTITQRTKKAEKKGVRFRYGNKKHQPGKCCYIKMPNAINVTKQAILLKYVDQVTLVLINKVVTQNGLNHQ